MGLNCSKPRRKERFERPEPARRWDSDDDLDLEWDVDVDRDVDLDPDEAKAEGPPSSLRTAPHNTLSSIVNKIAAHMSAVHLPWLQTALPVLKSDREMIMNKFPGHVPNQAATLMHFWLNAQRHRSAEILLRRLREVGLNYDWVLDDARLEPPRPEGGAGGRQKPPRPEGGGSGQRGDKGTQTEEGNLRTESRPVVDKQTETEGGVTRQTQTEEGNLRKEVKFVEKQTKPVQVLEARWTPTELYDWLKDAPDPFTKPVDFQKHLRLFCIVYGPRPAQVRSLLELAYNSKWEKVEQHFNIPGADTDASWPDAVAMATWLDTICMTSVKTTAWKEPDFYHKIHCAQKPKESLSDFLSRYQQMWDSAWGEEYDCIATTRLVNKLKPHVAELFQLKFIGWENMSLAKAIFTLKEMDSRGWFESKRKTLVLIQELKALQEDFSSDQLELQPLPWYGRPRFGKRRGHCYYCGKWGHWVRECRAAARQQPKQLALGWQYVD